MTGIYKIQSKARPDRIYVGSAANIKGRLATHSNRLRKGNHHSIKLQRHFNKYGASDLQFETILICDKDLLIINEQEQIDLHKPYFNVAKVAGSTLGVPCSEENKRKAREYYANKVYTPEEMEVFKTFQGKRHTEETKRKIGEGNKGKVLSQETRDKLSAAKTGKKLGKYKVPCSDERKRKISEAKKGKPSWNKGLPRTWVCVKYSKNPKIEKS